MNAAKWLLPMVAAILQAGCIASAPPLPAQRYYLLEPSLNQSGDSSLAAASADGTQLLVDRVEAPGIFSERPLLWRAADPAAPLQQYPYAAWAEPPDAMLRAALVAQLRRRFGATAVQDARSRMPVRGELQLRLHVQHLEQILDGKDGASARLAMTLTVVDDNGRLLAVMPYDNQRRADGRSPMEFVRAENVLIADAFRQFATRIATLVKSAA